MFNLFLSLFFFFIFSSVQAQDNIEESAGSVNEESFNQDGNGATDFEEMEVPNQDSAEETELDATGDNFENTQENSEAQVPALSEDEVLIEQIENLNQINEGKFILRPYIYNQRGRRDPFTPIVSDKASIRQNSPKKKAVLPGLEKYRIDSFTLTSILWSVDKPKALVIDPEKKVHLITRNSRIGTKNGYVVDIKEGSVIVVEEEKDEEGKSLFTTQVLKMGR